MIEGNGEVGMMLLGSEVHVMGIGYGGHAWHSGHIVGMTKDGIFGLMLDAIIVNCYGRDRVVWRHQIRDANWRMIDEDALRKECQEVAL